MGVTRVVVGGQSGSDTENCSSNTRLNDAIICQFYFGFPPSLAKGLKAEDLIEGYLSLLHIWENSLGQPIRCMILKDCQSNSSWIPYAANEIARTPEFRQARGIRIKTSALNGFTMLLNKN